MTSVPNEFDPMTLRPPRWFSTAVAWTAEMILIVVTLVIIAAMWLPAYLTSANQNASTLQDGNQVHADRPEERVPRHWR